MIINMGAQRLQSKIKRYILRMQKKVDYNEACHEHLYPLSESIVNLRNALRDMNGENGFLGVFRKSK